MKTGTFENFAALKGTFPSVDKVGNLYVFNVAGNHLRIVAAIHFNRGKVFLRAIMTHAEYDTGDWKR
jgi:mRNA interferase HigB